MTFDSSRPFRVRLIAEVGSRRHALARAFGALRWKIDFDARTDGALERAEREESDLVVLDWHRASDRDLTPIRRLCRDGTTTVVVVAHGVSDVDAARLLEAGASDVIREPLRSPLFMARCSTAKSRRTPLENDAQPQQPVRWSDERHESLSSTLLAVGPICLDVARRRAMIGAKVVPLTRSEFLILARLAQTPGVPVSDLELVTDVLREPFRAETSIARVHVHRARRKLGPHGKLIQNVRPRAYRLVPPALAAEEDPPA